MNPLKRRVGSATYTSAGSVSTIELPRNYNYRRLLCRITGTNTTAGGTAGGAVHPHAAHRAISRLELIANGRDTIMSISPEALKIMNILDYGCVPAFSNPSAITAAAYTFSASFILDLALVRSVRPIDTLFPAAGLSTLDLKVTWGAGLDMFTGAVTITSATISACELVVSSFEEVGAIPGGVGVNKLFTIDRTITAASTNFQIQVPVGNLYRGFLVHTKNDEVPVDTMLDGARVEAGTEVFQNWLTNDELLDYNKLNHHLETRLVGYHLLDWLDSDGFLSEILDTRKLSNLDITLNVALPSGTTRKVQVFPQEIILPAKG
jgi:hypothetical protein